MITVSKKRIGYVLAGVLGIIGGLVWYQHYHVSQGIVPYVPARDRAFILDQFKKNWYCLVSERVEFDPEYMLDTRSSSKKAEDLGNASIYTYCEKNEPVGFLVIHPKHGHGYILFLEVAEEHRRKGYGRSLFTFALSELRKAGYAYVDIATRVENFPAQGLYRSYGFFEIYRYDGFITLRKYF